MNIIRANNILIVKSFQGNPNVRYIVRKYKTYISNKLIYTNVTKYSSANSTKII